MFHPPKTGPIYIVWPNEIIFHQPRFPWNKGISLPQLPFGVRSFEVAIIWSDYYGWSSYPPPEIAGLMIRAYEKPLVSLDFWPAMKPLFLEVYVRGGGAGWPVNESTKNHEFMGGKGTLQWTNISHPGEKENHPQKCLQKRISLEVKDH